VDYYNGGDKKYLIYGEDDRIVKIWEYKKKKCVKKLEGNEKNI
jgi:coatomer subunit beta'